jgi:hypothetical protein
MAGKEKTKVLSHLSMKVFIFIVMLISTGNLNAADLSVNWAEESGPGYSIKFPTDFTLDKSGRMGTSFIIFSKIKGPQDKFKENINLIVQDLKGMNIDLKKYTDISEDQIKKMITNSKIEISKDEKSVSGEFHHIIYTGDQGIFRLKYEQYYFVKNEKAYVLTFTSEVSEYDDYAPTARAIMNSFTLK